MESSVPGAVVSGSQFRKLENQGYDYLLPINSNLFPLKKPKVNITYEIRYLLTIPKILKFVLSIPSLPDCRLSS